MNIRTHSYTTPSGITCTSSPAAPNFHKTLYAAVTTTCKPAAGVTIGQLATPAPGNPRGWWMAEGGTALAFLFLFGMPGRRRRWQSLIGSLALVVVAFGMTGSVGR
jgi:trimeric autotransporter adhesin